ncbi:site-2 protease family protein [Rhodopirellula sp. MGV]|uniref:site-2 protease family protein n=1 Tax=Rhodopirellula sp. MGV TaxID=2023130 RepID=UPI000B974FE0|nr:site-2 protease family protein [Rhodopirellula sp. MGV]OYP35808.1 hypothetical protein CGZ80_10435 [Rhodopirellula sp. MGV]PNY36379.1 hypothetical protein C2E31_13175 [Rhodopirellula baltica]
MNVAHQALRHRGDLEVYRQDRQRHNRWVIKDPISLRYFEFSEEEFFIFRHLDGKATYREIRACFEDAFVARQITVEAIQAFAERLHQNGLMLARRNGQGDRLLERHRSQRRKRLIAAMANPLGIRFPGVDPKALLDRITPWLGWLFSAGCAWGIAGAASISAMLLAFHWDLATERLPAIDAFLSPLNVILLAMVLAGTKIIHELAHAVACRRFGAKCHEIGVMLLVFTPCLYCDVTDSWTLRNRWHRIAISSAGIFAELSLAVLCGWLWWFTSPSLANTILFNVMVVCSVGTILINGNPLLRYDGYFVFSDFVDVPNLWQRSGLVLRGIWHWCLTGRGGVHAIRRRVGESVSLSLLGLYATASAIYRGVVLVSILLLIHHALVPAGFHVVAYAMELVIVSGLLLRPLVSIGRSLKNPMFRQQIKATRLTMILLLLGVCIVTVIVVPFPIRVSAPVVVQAKDARQIYVTVPGTLESSVAVGERVQQGELLATLENLDLDKQIEQVRSEIALQEIRLQNLHSLRNESQDIAAQIPLANQVLLDLQSQLRQRLTDKEALRLVAPRDGIVFPAPSQKETIADQLQLISWQGRPTDGENRGSFLSRQTLFCLVASPEEYEVIAYVGEDDVALVESGQSVDLSLQSSRGEVVRGTVKTIARINVDQVPAELTIDKWVPSVEQSQASAVPLQPTYKVSIVVDDETSALLVGGRGIARIGVSPRTLSSIFDQAVRSAFNESL